MKSRSTSKRAAGVPPDNQGAGNAQDATIINWDIEADIARFSRLAHTISVAYTAPHGEPMDLSHLIEHTTGILGAGIGVPESHWGQYWSSIVRVRAAWKQFEDRWEGGAIDDAGATLGRKRPKGWRRAAHAKHQANGPLVFAEISFELSKRRTRTEAVQSMARRYAAAKSQIDKWYDSNQQVFRIAAKHSDFASIPEPIVDAFYSIAKRRGGNAALASREMLAAFQRARKSTQKSRRTSG